MQSVVNKDRIVMGNSFRSLLSRWFIPALTATLILCVASAFAIPIDEFNEDQPPAGVLRVEPGSPIASSTIGGTMIGGSRDLFLRLNAGQEAEVLVIGGEYNYSTIPDTNAIPDIVWDGNSNPAVLDPTGLGGINLDPIPGFGGIRIVIIAYDLPFGESTDLRFEFWDAADPSGESRSAGTITITQRIVNSTSLELLFSDTVQSGANGPADFSNIGAISFTLVTNLTNAVDFTMDLVESCVDINGDGTLDCDQPVCGNGIVEAGEECDDGNQIDNDSCTNGCMNPECGDGIIQAGEQCDDGNQINNDSCTNICTTPICGDGIVQVGEQCDDGNQVNNDGCTNQCTTPICGDGIIQAGEQCDDGNQANNDGCSSSCRLEECGDGIVQPGEQCDDGNQVNNDGCTNSCTTPICGDGIVQTGEQCDDGNQVNNDGCTDACTTPFCGDGIVQAGEQCDDGNQMNNDGCTNTCTTPICGDGIVQAGEQCDDGNQINNDSCTNVCTTPICGDGIVQAGEQCDDGNQVNNDGCTNACTSPICGDGIIQQGEQCDDGNSVNDDGCTNTCTTPTCGDGIVQTGEQCDDGNNINGDGCDNDCTIPAPICPGGEEIVRISNHYSSSFDNAWDRKGPRCNNDGRLDNGEQCDDGNLIDTDACSNACRFTGPPTACNLNGNRDPGEQCDDGPAGSNNCSTSCEHIRCGNGILQTWEQCDDGNNINGDGCDSTCSVESLNWALRPAPGALQLACWENIRQQIFSICQAAIDQSGGTVLQSHFDNCVSILLWENPTDDTSSINGHEFANPFGFHDWVTGGGHANDRLREIFFDRDCNSYGPDGLVDQAGNIINPNLIVPINILRGNSCDHAVVWHSNTPISLLLHEDAKRDPLTENKKVDLRKEIDLQVGRNVVEFDLDLANRDLFHEWIPAAHILVHDPYNTNDVKDGSQLLGTWAYGGQPHAALGQGMKRPIPWNHGFQALAMLDRNGDRRIAGEELESLKLWKDKNGNAQVEDGELKPISEYNITALFFEGVKRDPETGYYELAIGYERLMDGEVFNGPAVDWISKSSAVKFSFQ